MSDALSPAFTAANLTGARHGFFGRQGGVSTGIYASLNAGTGSDDDPESVRENRARIATAMQAEHLTGVHQVHSPKAVFVDGPWSGDRPQADALVTTTPGFAISVLTADCAPVLMIDPQAGVIAAAHAGWKGALGGVLKSTILLMKAHGADPARISAAIGPCIHQPSYEVGADFKAQFVAANADYARFFAAGAPGKFQFDLPLFCVARLNAAGVEDVEVAPHDTYRAEAHLFSHRRSVHRVEPGYGRNCAAIAL